MASEAARLLAVRRVTEENQGKHTAGVDGVKSLTQEERLMMASTIHPNNWKHQRPAPVRRVWIPKPGTSEQRALAILPMIDRCKQALVKLALEPGWEARFEDHSYGFRPNRGTYDAMAAILVAIERHPMFVFNADIEKAFDHLNQTVILDKLQTYPALREAINAWLKAGVVDGGTYLPSETGIPQGGLCKALHKPPYAKQVTMQSNCKKTLIFRHFQLNFLCIVSDEGFEILLNSLSGENVNAPTNAKRLAPGSIFLIGTPIPINILAIKPVGLPITMQRKSDSNARVSSFSCSYFA
jgi:hypothetical protein